MNDRDIISFHCKLLNAPERMEKYQQAIHNTVKPGDIVIDLGCGSGILGLFACQAGASKVYAIERSSAISLAKTLAKANGFADTIVYIDQDVKDVKLDIKADVIVSELISKGVLGQKMAETIGWCRDNLLKPDGKILPAKVDLFVAPIEDENLYQKVRLPDSETYSLNFSCVAERSVNVPLSARIKAENIFTQGQVGYHYEAITAPMTDHVDCTLIFKAERCGVIHGFALWFSSLLSDGVILDNTPPGIPAWDNLFLPLTEPITVESGTTIELKLRGRDDSNMPFLWAWDTIIKSGDQNILSQKQSTLFAQLGK